MAGKWIGWISLLVLTLLPLGTIEAQLIEYTPTLEITPEIAFTRIVWSPDSTQILAWGDQAQVWNIIEPGEPIEFSNDKPLNGAAWQPDNTQIAFWADTYVYLWQPDTNQQHTLPHMGLVRGVAWNPDGIHLATWSTAGELYIWLIGDHDTPDPNPVALEQPPDFTYGIGHAEWLAGGQHIMAIIVGDDYVFEWVHVWDITDPSARQSLRHERGVNGMIGDARGEHILTWAADGTARLWTLDGSQEPIIFQHNNPVCHAAWDGYANRIVTIDANGHAWTWQWDSSGASAPQQLNHPGGTYDVAASAVREMARLPRDHGSALTVLKSASGA